MYRRSKFLEALLEIRREMALEADYDVVLFVESARKGHSGKPLVEIQPEAIDIEHDVLRRDKRRPEVGKR